MAQQNRGGRHVRQGGEANQHSSFKDFQDTNPPLFKEAVEPLEAVEWLNTLEQKFRSLWVTEELKAKYAAHQLEGKAGVWWSNYRTSLPAVDTIFGHVSRMAGQGGSTMRIAGKDGCR